MLEEFLEELDALTDDSREDLKDQDSRAKPDPSSAPEEARDLSEDPDAQKRAQTSSPWASEKKVRFSEELVQAFPAKQTSQGSASPESKGSSEALSPKKNKREVERPRHPAGKQEDSQDKGGSLSAPPVAHQQVSETEHTETERSPPAAPSPPPAEKASASLQPVEVSKCSSNGTNTGNSTGYLMPAAEDEPSWIYSIEVCLSVLLAKHLMKHRRDFKDIFKQLVNVWSQQWLPMQTWL